MKKGALSHTMPFVQFLLIFIIVLLSSVVVTLIGVLMALPVIGLNGIMEIATAGGSIAVLKYLQVVQSFSIFVVPSLIVAWLFSYRPMHWLWFRAANWRLVVISVLLIFVAQPFTAWSAQWNASLSLPESLRGIEMWMKTAEESASGIIFRFLDTANPWVILFNVFMIAVLPAFGEEMLFRGAIQPTFQRWVKNHHLAIWFTAFVFSAMHMQFLTFLPRFILGGLLGYMLVYGGSIWYPIAAHFLNNLMSLVVFHYYRAFKPDVNPLDPNLDAPSWWLAIGSLLVACYVWWLLRSRRTDKMIDSNQLMMDSSQDG